MKVLTNSLGTTRVALAHCFSSIAKYVKEKKEKKRKKSKTQSERCRSAVMQISCPISRKEVMVLFIRSTSCLLLMLLCKSGKILSYLVFSTLFAILQKFEYDIAKIVTKNFTQVKHLQIPYLIDFAKAGLY